MSEQTELVLSKSVHTLKVYFDGGARPTNPGNGYGSYEISSERLKHKCVESEFGSPLTNNQAEYLSLLAALKWLRHHVEPAETSLSLFSDSKLLVMQMQGSWKIRVLHIQELAGQAHELLVGYRDWTIHWHPRERNVERFGH